MKNPIDAFLPFIHIYDEKCQVRQYRGMFKGNFKFKLGGGGAFNLVYDA